MKNYKKNHKSSQKDSASEFAELVFSNIDNFKSAEIENNYYFTDKVMNKLFSEENYSVNVWIWLGNVLFSKAKLTYLYILALIMGFLLAFSIKNNNIQKNELIFLTQSDEVEAVEEVHWAGLSYTALSEFFNNQN